MSEFVLSTILFNVKEKDLKLALKEIQFEGYTRKLTTKKFALTHKIFGTLHEMHAVQLSRDLNSLVINLSYSSDHGWGLVLYKEGETVCSYELDTDDSNEVPSFPAEFMRSAGFHSVMIDLLVHQLQSDGSHESSWEHFLETIECSDLGNHFTYDFLQNQSQSLLERMSISEVTSKDSKGFNFKKVVMEQLAAPLKELGFEYQSDFLIPCDYAFTKNIHGFEVGLLLYKYDNSIDALLKTLYNDRALMKQTHFSDKKELSLLLTQLVNQFREFIQLYQEDLLFEPFDYAEVFKHEMMDFLSGLGYISDPAISNFSNLVGGEQAFTNRLGEKLVFQHGKFYISLICEVVSHTEVSNLSLLSGKYGDHIKQIFRTKEEYIQILTQCKQVLRQLNI